MEIIRGLHNLHEKHRGNVITIGNFDGVHLGHQAIIQRLREEAEKHDVPGTLITFEPHPQEYFTHAKSPNRLTRFREKMELLTHYGVDRVVLIPFNAKLANISAERFIEEILIKGLHTQYLVIGDDFRFGKDRLGDFNMLQAFGKTHQYEVDYTPTHCVNNERVSSTRVRQALNTGDLLLTRALLGRAYHISGKIAHGDKRGRTIGFPTANVKLKQQIAPLNGVYAVRITGLSDTYWGVANLGVRPTVDGKQYLFEVHIFNFDDVIYGERLNFHFEHFIRPEQKFDGLEALIAQIQKDCETAKTLLKLR